MVTVGSALNMGVSVKSFFDGFFKQAGPHWYDLVSRPVYEQKQLLNSPQHKELVERDIAESIKNHLPHYASNPEAGKAKSALKIGVPGGAIGALLGTGAAKLVGQKLSHGAIAGAGVGGIIGGKLGIKASEIYNKPIKESKRLLSLPPEERHRDIRVHAGKLLNDYHRKLGAESSMDRSGREIAAINEEREKYDQLPKLRENKKDYPWAGFAD